MHLDTREARSGSLHKMRMEFFGFPFTSVFAKAY